MTTNQLSTNFVDRLSTPPGFSAIRSQQWFIVLIATIGLFIVAGFLVPASLSSISLSAMLASAAVLAVAAAGQTLVIQQRGIDLSAAGVMTLTAVAMGHFSTTFGFSALTSVLLALVMAALIGALNGLLITKLGITPIIATLAVNSVAIGMVWSISNGAASSPPAELVTFAKQKFIGLPIIAVVAIVIVLLLSSAMARTRYGRVFTAVGAAERATRATGIQTNKYIFLAYIASSMLAGLAAVLLTGFIGTISIALGDPYQLPIIAAVVVGGAALAGGKGSILATAIACVFLEQIVQMVLAVGAPTSVQLLVQSLALGVAAALKLIGSKRNQRRQQEQLLKEDEK